MDDGMKPIRRVATGNDECGRSKMLWDGPAPDVHGATPLTNAWTDFWVWNESPAPLSGSTDDGSLHYDFPGSRNGGHLRAVYGKGKPAHYDPEKDPKWKPFHAPVERPAGRTWDRGGRNAYTSDMHKTETVDYAILLHGERNLVLDDGEVQWRPGDIVIDVAAYHQWTSPRDGGIVLYDVIAARLVQGNAPVMHPDPARKVPAGVKPVRRLVCADREVNRSCLISDGSSPDVRLDPARPGFASQRMWVTDATPAKIVTESLQLPNVLEPPGNGSVLNVFTFPPEAEWEARIGSRELKAYFESIGSPSASTYTPQAPHPCMQKTSTLDFCVILEGEITLQLDMQEVPMKAREIAILRGANHAWRNRSTAPAVIAIASYAGRF